MSPTSRLLTITLSLWFVVGGCDGVTTLHVTKHNLRFARAMRKGEIQRSELSDSIVDLSRNGINKILNARGIGDAFEENWDVGEVGDYTIISGSAAKTRNEIYAFLFVSKVGEGLVYYEVGQDSIGVLPEGLIPDP